MSRPLIANRETKNEESAWAARIKRRDGGKCQILRSDRYWTACLRGGQLDGAHIYRRAQCAKAKFVDAVGISSCRDCHDVLDGRRWDYEVRVPLDRRRAAWDAIKLASKVMTIGDRP
jgi:hypothetical protein